MSGPTELDPEEWKAWAAVAALYSGCVVLHLLVPCSPTDGYVLDARTGRPLQYRNNGLLVHLLLVAAAALLVQAGAVDGAFLYHHYWAAVRAGCTFSLIASVVFFLDGRAALAEGRRTGAHTIDRNVCTPTTSRPVVVPDPTEFEARSALKHFVLGIRFNPRPSVIGGADFKMMLYVLGANMLHLVILSAAYHHYTAMPPEAGVALPVLGAVGLARATLVYVGMFTWFVVEYLYYEHVHVFTYDVFRERVGFTLTWGCFTFYPFFYCIGVWPLADFAPTSTSEDISPAVAVACAGLFFLGWTLTRGANLQKYAFREDPTAKEFTFPFFQGLIRTPQRTLAAAGPGRRVLVSGFWGLSRHVNYCGELMQSLALCIPGVAATGSLLPLLYPLFYLALFIPRQLDDDKICAEKYGAAVWAEYVRRVPYRIVPGVY